MRVRKAPSFGIFVSLNAFQIIFLHIPRYVDYHISQNVQKYIQQLTWIQNGLADQLYQPSDILPKSPFIRWVKNRRSGMRRTYEGFSIWVWSRGFNRFRVISTGRLELMLGAVRTGYLFRKRSANLTSSFVQISWWRWRFVVGSRSGTGLLRDAEQFLWRIDFLIRMGDIGVEWDCSSIGRMWWAGEMMAWDKYSKQWWRPKWCLVAV